MMPQPITNSSNTYTMLHQINESQLSIGEVQISGIYSKCSALGTLLTQEITQHKSRSRKNKAKELARELNGIGAAIHKNLIQQLPLIKKQMQQSLIKMIPQEGMSTTYAEIAQDQTYVKTADLLQENILRIDQQLNTAMKRVLQVIPQKKQEEFQKLLDALTIYQSTLCGSSLLSAEFGRLSVFLGSLKLNVEMYVSGVGASPERTKLLELSSMIDELLYQSQGLFESFQEQTVNNIPILKVFESAKQKYLSLGKQLTEGDVSNADVLLAVAQRHDTDAILANKLQEMNLMYSEFDSLNKEVLGFLEKIQLEDINSLADELIQSEPVEVAAAQAIIKKPKKAASVAVEQEPKLEVTGKPTSDKSANLVEKPFGTQFHVELSKLADWLNHDVKALKNSTSGEKRKLGQVIAEQLEEVYGQIDASQWPAGKTEALKHKTDIEKRLGALEQLIAEAMAQKSPPQSPKAAPEKVVAPKTRPAEQQSSSDTKLPALPAKAAAPQVAAVRNLPKTVTFDSRLQMAIQKLNSARTRMLDAYYRQESFRQTLLASNQPESLAWVNIDQTDMVLDYISQNIAFHPHVLYVKPYAEHCLPMAEMIRAIQSERFHPHFDQRNCQAYLGHASNWLDTLTPHFDYLEQLMSITESMLTNQQRVA